jgi:Tol biopolymer transport system component
MRSIALVAGPLVSFRLAVMAALASAAFAALACSGPVAAAGAARNGLIAYEGRASANGYLYLRKPDGSRPIFVRATGRPSAPAVSPLGRRIAFSSGGEIWTVYVDGAALHQVTAGELHARAPAWAPAADALAFESGPRGARDIFRVGADGNDVRRLTFDPADELAPSWSSRGRIAYVRRTPRGDGDIFAVSGRGGRARRLTRGATDDADPAWSPAGRFIAFTRGRRGGHEVFVMRADGSKLRRLTRLGHDASSPAWSPDGRSIAFALRGPHGWRWLYVMRRDGRRVRRVGSSTSQPRSLDWQATGFDPVVAAAGDIACDPASPAFNGGLGLGRRCRQRATSDSLFRMDLSAILALGDLQYQDGQLAKFLGSFDPSWGRLKPLIRPVPGNHEYGVAGAAGYFDYFNGLGVPAGPAGTRGAGYYSFDLGRWHVVALNSECAPSVGAPDCSAGSPQERWLRADLTAHGSRCTLAFFHHPLMSSGLRAFNSHVASLWQALVAFGVEVALVGHDHAYERFAPINATGAGDPLHGVREFVVGTGGKSVHKTTLSAPNSEVRAASTPGVLQLTLHPAGYSWSFVAAGAGRFRDSGSAACH